jgi:hypothetical protein
VDLEDLHPSDSVRWLNGDPAIEASRSEQRWIEDLAPGLVVALGHEVIAREIDVEDVGIAEDARICSGRRLGVPTYSIPRSGSSGWRGIPPS